MKGRYVGGAGSQGRFGRKRFGTQREAPGETALSSCCQIVLAGLAKVLPNTDLSSHSPKKLPRPGFTGVAPKFGNAVCFNCSER